MHDEYISISSPGEAFIPLEWKDVTCTNPRNQRLADLLVRMKYADLRGKGMMVIRNSYSGSGLIPCIIKESGMFSVKLPAMDNPVKEKCFGAPAITDYLERNRGALLSDISKDLMISVHCAKKIIDSMESEGEIFTLGLGSKRRAYLINPYRNVNETEQKIIQ